MYILSVVAILLVGVFAWQQYTQGSKKKKSKKNKNKK